MILKTFDGKEMYVTREQAEKINIAIAGGVKMIQINGNYYAAGAIATIIRGGTDPNQKTLPPPERPALPPEQLEANKAKLAKIRELHFGKKA